MNSILVERPTDLCLAEYCLYLYQGKEPKTGAWLEPTLAHWDTNNVRCHLAVNVLVLRREQNQ